MTRPATSCIGTPSSIRAASGVMSTCTPRETPSCSVIVAGVCMPTRNESNVPMSRSRSGGPNETISTTSPLTTSRRRTGSPSSA